jgi:hypothetical protein
MQKTILVDIDQNSKATVDGYIAQGYILHQIVNLQPAINKLLIIYYEPPVEPEP